MDTTVWGFERLQTLRPRSIVSTWLNVLSLYGLAFPKFFKILSIKKGFGIFFASLYTSPSKALHASRDIGGHEHLFLWHVLQTRWFHTIGTSSWAFKDWKFFHIVVFKYAIQQCLYCCYWWWTIGFCGLWMSTLEIYCKWDRQKMLESDIITNGKKLKIRNLTFFWSAGWLHSWY